jgi:hypothetical protein
LGIANPKDILDIAESEVRAADALRDDLLAALFPYGTQPPSELLQTRVKIKLQALVAGLQSALEIDRTSDKCWDLLARSGLLREKPLIEFALARLAEEKLQRQLAASGLASRLAQLPVELLRHENVHIADLAKTLLQAEQVSADDRYLYKRLAPELLHLLCWRIVAAAQDDGATESPTIARELLAAHSGDGDPTMLARKLAFFLGAEWHVALADPRKAGLHLFIAHLAQQTLLSADLLLRLLGEGGIEPSLLLLKVAAIPAEDLTAILADLRGAEELAALPLVLEQYDQLDLIEVRAQIASWAQVADTAA